MIQWFKEVIQDSIVFKAFMGLMVVSFGIWGIGDVITPGIDPNIAIQGGRFEVRATDLQRRFQAQLERMRENLGAEAIADPALKQMVLNNTVEELRRTAITNMAAFELGIDVTPERVRDNITARSAFKDETGTFNPLKFSEVLIQNQLTETGFTKLVEDDLRQQTLLNPIGVSAGVPQSMAEILFSYRSETRVADTLLVAADAMAAPEAPTEEQVKKTYDENITAFTAPEYRTIKGVAITTNDLVPINSIDESAVRAFYDENAERYRTPETRKLSQLVFETKEQAEAARVFMAPGDDLSKIAAKAKIGPPIDLGERTLADPIIKPFGDAVKIAVNEISQPLQTDLGWHLLQVSSITPEQVTPYEDVKDKVRQTLANDKGTDALFEASVKLEDEVAAGTPFDEIAKAIGGRYIIFNSIDRQGNNSSGVMIVEPVLSLVAPDKIYATAFSTPVGTESTLIEFQGGYYILRVESVTSPAPKPLEAVRSDVVKMWEKEQRLAAAKIVAEKISADVSPSVTMTSIADKDKRLSYAKLGPITRFGESLSKDYVVDAKRVGPDMLNRLFSAKADDKVISPVLGGYLVARLKEIIPAKAEGDLAQTFTDIQLSTRNAIGQDLLQQFSTAIAVRYPATINSQVIADLGGGVAQ